MLFKCILEIEEDMFGELVYSECDDAGGFFKACYDFKDISMTNEIIVLDYFTFTTLSTVGFGDYNPKSNIERLILAFLMLFGVAIFSIVMA